MHRPIIALYGNVSIQKVFCKECGCDTFVRHNIKACCGGLLEDTPLRFVRISEPAFIRKLPSKAEREKILEEQGYACLYCEQRFGQTFYRHVNPLVLRIVWDHKLPFSYSADNGDKNFAACCQVCNNIKRDLVFQTIMDARVYIADVRKTKGYNF